MLTITRQIWGWMGESQWTSKRIGNSISLAGPDKESLNNPDLSNAVSHGKVVKYQRREPLPVLSCNYSHLGTCKFYIALTKKTVFWHFFKVILLKKSYFINILFLKIQK